MIGISRSGSLLGTDELVFATVFPKTAVFLFVINVPRGTVLQYALTIVNVPFGGDVMATDFEVRVQNKIRSFKDDCLPGGAHGITGCVGEATLEAVCDNFASIRCCTNEACIEDAKAWSLRNRRNVRNIPIYRLAFDGEPDVPSGARQDPSKPYR